MWHTVSYFFSWPTGQIWPNLLASVLWTTPTLLHLHRKINRIHKRMGALIDRPVENVILAIEDELA